MGRKGNTHALLVGMQTDAATLKTVWSFLKKLKMKLPYDPADYREPCTLIRWDLSLGAKIIQCIHINTGDALL